jgi:aryl-alcohol dehydrogenase
LDDPKPSEVLVKVEACGVCHTDSAGLYQFIPVTLPAVFGHEAVGIVEKKGSAVDSLEVGDHVIMTYPSCGTCDCCKSNHPYACDIKNDLFFNGSYKDGSKRFKLKKKSVSSFFGQGGFADHVVVDARNAVKVDKDVDLPALCSLGCGVQTGAGSVLNGLKPEPGSSLVVFGCGAVGISAIMAAKIAGCSKIIAVDVVPERLKLCKKVGATDTINAKRVKDVCQAIRDLTGGRGANYSVECSGIPEQTINAVECLDVLGKAVVASVTGEATVDIALEPMLMNPSRTLMGLVEGGSNPQTFIPQLVQFYKEGKLPVDKMVKYYKFEDIEQAFEDSKTGKTIKPVLLMGKGKK